MDKMSTKELRAEVRKKIANGVQTIRFVRYVKDSKGVWYIHDINECELHTKFRYGSMYDGRCVIHNGHHVVLEDVWNRF